MTNRPQQSENAAVVLGGFVNGYSIIRELRERGVKNIFLLDSKRSLASYSNKIDGFSRIDDGPRSLQRELARLSERYQKLVIYPTSDLHLENLHEIYDDVSPFCFLPFNRENLMSVSDKTVQYEHCERLGVPYPRSVQVTTRPQLEVLAKLQYPLLLKPCKRVDLTTNTFRSLLLETPADLDRYRVLLEGIINQKIGLMASEIIPGDDTVIYAYVAYISGNGHILNEWIGKKLTQFPDRFGVFSSASNEAPEIVRELGRRLVEGMGLFGIVEPEFKYDYRDGQYKLMEINLRSMMWHRLGNRTGVNLQFTQWQDALGLPATAQTQEMEQRVHFVYGKHELLNVLLRHRYWKHFRHNLFGGDKCYFAVCNWRDPKPLLQDLLSVLKLIVRQCRKKLRIR